MNVCTASNVLTTFAFLYWNRFSSGHDSGIGCCYGDAISQSMPHAFTCVASEERIYIFVHRKVCVIHFPEVCANCTYSLLTVFTHA